MIRLAAQVRAIGNLWVRIHGQSVMVTEIES